MLAGCIGLIVAFGILGHRSAFPGTLFWRPNDFTIFHTAAHIVLSGDGHRLYDLHLQAQVQQAILEPYGQVFADGLLPYNYPPFLLIVLLPLGKLPIVPAFYAWTMVNIILTLATILLLLRSQRRLSPKAFAAAAVLVFSFFPVFQALANGQSSFLALFLLAVTYTALKRGREFLAGLSLAAALIKPQLLIVIVAVLLWRRRWRVLSALSITAILLVLASYIVVGVDGMSSYFRLVWQMGSWQDLYGIDPRLMPNLRGTVVRLAEPFATWLGQEPTGTLLTAVYLVLSLPVVAWTLHIWSCPWRPAETDFDMQFGFCVAAALFLSPHLYPHDLTLLVLVAFAAFYVLDQPERSLWASALMAVGHVTPLLATIALGTAGGVQASALLLIGIMVVLHREMRLTLG